MKNIMIIDDDPSIVKMLSMIIETNKLGNVIMTLSSGEHAVDEILFAKPDIVLIDLLLPVLDGIKIIANTKSKDFNGKFIMISQVEDSLMISNAYREGTFFYISKPINSNEVSSIIREVSRVIDLENSVSVIQAALKTFDINAPTSTKQKLSLDAKINSIFSEIGISSESGADDLRIVIKEIIHQREITKDSSYHLQSIYEIVTDNTNTRTFEQRIRRIIIKAFMNLAELGHSDYYDPTFSEYASLLFDMKQIKIEIRRIEGNSGEKGKTNVKKFLEGIITKVHK